MNPKARSRFYRMALVSAAIAFGLVLCAHAQTETVLYSFNGTQAADGNYPNGLTFDSHGNLFGTTQLGGIYGYGTVFELMPTSSGWIELVLHSFANGPDGGWPMGGVVVDAAGNLYGNTEAGGAYSCYNYISGCGLVYELSPQSDGTWAETILHNFTGGVDGSEPWTGMLLDAAGNLYGGTSAGGDVDGLGVVFKLSPQSSGNWAETVLYTCIQGRGGFYPQNMMLDKAGNLYGTMAGGGAYGYGTVFKLSPESSSQWIETVLHTFGPANSINGGPPVGSLALDNAGNIYGMSFGGGAHYGGAVYELSPTGTGGWGETILHSFGPVRKGIRPWSVVLNSQGNLFGVTNAGGNSSTCFDCGVILELTRSSSGVWQESEIYSFDGASGQTSWGVLIADKSGNVFGTTQSGGNSGYGVVFELSP
jgi:uncharacterized repeat protein (TIGR03803 family)